MRKIVFIIALLFPFASALAAPCPQKVIDDYRRAGKAPPDVCLDNPLGKAGNALANTDASELVGTIIKGVLAVIGSVSLFMMVWGGFQWLTSAGNTEKVEKGTKTMLWAVIGVILVFASYLLVNTLTTVLTKSSL